MKTPKKDEERGEYRFYPDLDDQPKGDTDLAEVMDNRSQTKLHRQLIDKLISERGHF